MGFVLLYMSGLAHHAGRRHISSVAHPAYGQLMLRVAVAFTLQHCLAMLGAEGWIIVVDFNITRQVANALAVKKSRWWRAGRRRALCQL